LKVAVVSREQEVHQIIRQLLSPWHLEFTQVDTADISIVLGETPPENLKSVIIPSDSQYFSNWLKGAALKFERTIGTDISVAATNQTILRTTPKTNYSYYASSNSVSSVDQSLFIKLNDNLLLRINIIEEYKFILNEVLNPKVSTLYRLLTGLPIPYTIAPRQVRDLLMKRNLKEPISNLNDKLPLDALRFILAKSIEELTHERLATKMWNGNSYACALTHDVDTRQGLANARLLKKLELKYDVPSAWYIPTKHYELHPQIIRELGNHGEVGTHDTKHDGKLNQLSKDELLHRLLDSRQTLEKIIEKPVIGFRSPLLQYSHHILGALKNACYAYDTSIPTWEARNPETMKSHGIGTIYPLILEGFPELPVTMPQDHQLLHVLGLSPRETIDVWLQMIKATKELGGLCMILVHPDYDLAFLENLPLYEDLLNFLISDNQLLTSLPSDILRIEWPI
jgi:peptidoglycan/xylan/chitin deacetylase (PgdA/CDA1 family)